MGLIFFNLDSVKMAVAPFSSLSAKLRELASNFFTQRVASILSLNSLHESEQEFSPPCQTIPLNY